MVSIDESRCVNCGSCVRSCPMGVLGKGESAAQVLPRRRCISCGHCVAACPKYAITLNGFAGEAACIQVPSEPVEKLILQRRSVRHFQEKLPPRETLQWALDQAEYAPSGKNFHLNSWTVLWGRDVTEGMLFRVLDWCDAHGEAPELRKLYNKGTDLVTCGAPCMLVAWSPDDCLNPVVDSAVAMTTVELLLQSRGLSTCWGGYLIQVLHAAPELRPQLGIPEGHNARCALMIGYAERERYLHIPVRPSAKALWLEELPAQDGQAETDR